MKLSKLIEQEVTRYNKLNESESADFEVSWTNIADPSDLQSDVCQGVEELVDLLTDLVKYNEAELSTIRIDTL